MNAPKRAADEFPEADIDLMSFLGERAEVEGVGRMLSEMEPAQLAIAEKLAWRGWVEFYTGWRSVQWVRLTPKGTAMLHLMWRF